MITLTGVRVLTYAAIGLSIAWWMPRTLAQDTENTGAGSSSAGSTTTTTSSTTDSSSAGGAGPNYSSGANTGGGGQLLGSTNQTTGTGLFSKLPFELTITLREGYDDNPDDLSSHERGSAFTSGGIDVAYDFGDPRTRLSLSAGAGGTYYYEKIRVQDYDIDLHGGLDITHEATPRLTLRAKLYLAYLTEPNFTYAAGINQRVGNYFFTTDQFTANYEWLPRFSTATSYTINGLNYDNSTFGHDEDRVENTFGNEFRFLLVPTTTLVAEYRYQVITYAHVDSDSTTHYLLAGVDHTFTPRLLGSIRAGAEFRDYDRFPDRTEPYVEGTVTYASGKRSSVIWNIRYGLEEPDFPQLQNRKTFRTGLRMKQELTSRLTGQLSFFYEHDDNQGSDGIPSFKEDVFDVGISGRFAITPHLGIEAGYRHTQVTSGLSSLEYYRNHVFAGLNYAF